MYICICVYIYIYIYREREIDIDIDIDCLDLGVAGDDIGDEASLDARVGAFSATFGFRNFIVFFGPRPWHIEIRHRVKKTSTIDSLGFETLKLKIRRLKLWKPTVD